MKHPRYGTLIEVIMFFNQLLYTPDAGKALWKSNVVAFFDFNIHNCYTEGDSVRTVNIAVYWGRYA